jgi:ABC-2 type transport system permease protein
MRLETILILAKREYLARVRTKGFWIGTLALPLLMGAMFVLPSLLLSKARSDHRLVLVDETGKVAPALAESLSKRAVEKKATQFQVTVDAPQTDAEAQRAALDKRVLGGEIDSWLWISPALLLTDDSPGAGKVEYHAKSVSNFMTQEILDRSLSEVVRRTRFAAAGFDADQIAKLAAGVEITTLKVSETGSRGENGMAGLMVAYFLFFILYISLLMYGQQVMNGVLEEKSSRVVEVLVSSVQPFELMMGKFLGIGGAGLSQLGIWLGSFAIISAPGVVATMAWLPDGGMPTLSLAVIVNFLLFFVLGFFLYATFYGALGAAFNNVQEAQQAAGAMGFIFAVPAMLALPVINDPDSTLAVVASLIPPLTPLLMMLRIVVKMPPLWQVGLSYVLCLAFTVFMVWLCSRIYRIGILMYGKKPTFQELWRWLRYA